MVKKKIKVDSSEVDKAQIKSLITMLRKSSDPMIILFNSIINSEMVERMPEWVKEKKRKRNKIQYIIDEILFRLNLKVYLGLSLITISIIKDIYYPSGMDMMLLGFGLGIMLAGLRDEKRRKEK